MKLIILVKYIFFATVLFHGVGCGVKGKPQPPLEAPQLGAGKHPLSTTQKQRKQIEKTKRLVLPGEDQDWKESDEK